MAVDKITPKGLSIDTDERLVQNGMMPDATNITLSEGGEGTAGVLKNCKGTIPGTPFSDSDALPNLESKYYTIGEVSDPQRGFIYFFVVDTFRPTSYIYQYNVKTDSYRLVLKDIRLGFRPEYFVKADVVNASFTQGNNIYTALYFTDNVNPPRKINVDRALQGFYDGLPDDEWDYSVNTIKAASITPPIASFSTTTELQHNNFKRSTFQFATQIIYLDGEESAISPYSKLAFSERLSLHGIEEANTDQSIYNQVSLNVDNTCVIDVNIDNELILSTEVKKIRLLAREGNSGPFFVVDEFDPEVDISRSVYGLNTVVYDSASRKYKFFNDVLGNIVPTATEDKLFDNVPLRARAQSVVGNRLMYGNYTEGRPNVKTNTELSVSYKDDTAIRTQYVSQVDGYINLSFDNIDQDFVFRPKAFLSDDVNQNTIFPAGTEVQIDFGVNIDNVDIFNNSNSLPVWGVNVSVGLNSQYDGVTVDDSFYYVLDQFTSTEDDPDGLGDSNSRDININFVLSSDSTLDELIAEMSAQFSSISFSQEYRGDYLLTPSIEANNQFNDISGQDAPNLSMKPVNTPLDKNIKVVYGLSTTIDDAGDILCSPYVESVKVYTWETPGPLGILRDPDSGVFWDYNDSGQLRSGIDVGLNFFGNLLTSQFGDNYEYSIISITPLTGFKSGSLHKLGVVYYDKYNRSGFVNDIGGTYVGWYNDHGRLKPGVNKSQGEPISEDESFNGPASITVNFLHEPPSWAEAFQIVYPGRSSMDNFTQYSVVGAYVARKGDFESNNGEFREIDTESKRIYVSFETLDIYRDQKDTLKDYSFTEGDKLRVKSSALQDSINQIPEEIKDVYYSATDGSVIEFDVVGVELLTNDLTNPIAYNAQSPDDPHGPLASMDKRFIGKFLVLETSQIVGGALGSDSNQMKYIGFDWYHVAYENTTLGTPLQIEYPDGSVVSSALNLWQRQCIVEIYSPKKSSANQFYYEIGEAVKINRQFPLDQLGWDSYHGLPITIDSGDVHHRPVACKTADYVDTEDDGTYEFRWYVKDDWAYKTKVLEDSSPSEIISDAIWSKGRAHVKFENAATVRRLNGVTYSDAYAEDVDNLALSSFNPTLANFYSLDSKYGAVNYIYNYGSTGEMLSLQENKLSITTVDSDIFVNASGDANVALSSKVLGSTRYFVGDYGCGDHPESVLVYDNDVYFADVSRNKIIRFAGGQIVPISDKDVSSRFNEVFDKWSDGTNSFVHLSKTRKIISGYDPDEDVYYVTFYYDSENLLNYYFQGSSGYNFSDIYSTSQFNGYTLSYNVKGKFWQSKHSFIPTIYSNQNNTMYSCKHVYDASDSELFDTNPLIFHRHEDLADGFGVVKNRTVFYNQNSAQSDFTVISNVSPSSVKVYNAISYEGSSAPDNASILSSNGSKNDRIIGFVEREGSFYKVIPRDTSSNSTSQYIALGDCLEVDGDKMTIDGSLIGISIPIGANVVNQQLIDVSGPGGSTIVEGVDGNEITLSVDNVNIDPGETILLQLKQENEGDAIRGHYAEIKSTYNESNVYEVYCVNLHVTDSKLHHVNNN